VLNNLSVFSAPSLQRPAGFLGHERTVHDLASSLVGIDSISLAYYSVYEVKTGPERGSSSEFFRIVGSGDQSSMVGVFSGRNIAMEEYD
jgi:hypothetical protein